MSNKPIIFSGIQPSGTLHIGAYFGALKNWIDLQKDYHTYFCIVDLHAITVFQEPEKLQKNTLDLAKLYIASGINPEESTIFIQSQVSAHAELAWVLNCFTSMGELEKMTQFKDKSANKKRPSNGLFSYPALMAADILLYNTDLVPVGEDQTQHLELTRTLAKRLNNKYNQELFKIPEVFIPKVGARIRGLQNPTKKMSKSNENKNDAIFMLDDAATITKKINKAVTDTEGRVYFDQENKPGVSNLLTILSACCGTSIEDLQKEYDGVQYGQFKKGVAEHLIAILQPIQDKYHAMSDAELLELLRKNAQQADDVSQETLQRLYSAMGIVK